MTIEASLDRIAAALEKIASAAPSVAPAIPEPAALPAPEAGKRGRPRKEAPAPAPEPAAPTDFLGDDEQEAAALTLQDVRAALVALQKRTHAENARKVLKAHGGVDSLSSLSEDRFAQVIAAANAGK